MSVDSGSQDNAQIILGLRASKAYPMQDGTLVLTGRVAETFELTSVTPDVGESFTAAPGTDFVLRGVNSAPHANVIGAGVAYEASQQWSVLGHYQGLFNGRQSDNTFVLEGRFAW